METVQTIRAETITLDKVIAAIVRTTGNSKFAAEIALSASTRDFLRQMRESQLATAPGWIDLDPPTFAFPGWGPQWRPFDWSVD